MIRTALLLAALLCSCTGSAPPDAPPAVSSEPEHVVEATLSVDLVGTAQNAKLGAVLVTESGDHHVDLDAWPDAVVGRKVRVQGRPEIRADVPVVPAYVPGEPVSAGVPLEPGADAERARERAVIADLEWQLVEE